MQLSFCPLYKNSDFNLTSTDLKIIIIFAA
jgi:hypothetical protein